MVEESLKLAKIWIVDDQEYNISLLERILDRAGFKNLHSSVDPHQTVPLIDPHLSVSMVEMHMHENEGEGYNTVIGKYKLSNNGDQPERIHRPPRWRAQLPPTTLLYSRMS